MTAYAPAAGDLIWTDFDPRTGRWSDLPSMRTPRHGLGGVALGRRVYAIQGGVEPGFSFSDAIEFLDVRRR